MSEPAETDFSIMDNQFHMDCEALRKSEISEERISALCNLWETFHDGYKSNSLRDADRCLECLLICTAQLVFNVNYSKKISSDSKKKLKGAIISCGNMHECVHRQRLLNGIGSIIENPWQATSFNNTVTGPKSKKEDASNKLWETEGWVMLESRVDYLSKIGQKCIDRVCSVLHVLVEKGHEMFRKNGSKPISFHPYEFPYHKYIEYLEVYALLHFNNLVNTQIVDTWEPPVLLEVISSLVKKAGDPNCPRLFPKLKQWKDAGEAGTFFAKKATWRALKLPNATLLTEFFSIWMEMSGFVDNGTEQSEAESPIDEIIKEEITCTANLYQIADVTIKLMGETSFTRLKYVELFVLAMTKDMTVIEAMKRTQPDMKTTIKELEEKLSIRYLDLTRFFKDYPKTAKDCLITAFSLYPCQKLFTFLFPSSLSETENIDIAVGEESVAIPAEYDDIKEMELENCDLKVEDDLDLGDASDDLATLIHNPRYKGFLTLNSNEELKKVCLKLLHSKSVAFIENRTLDFVKVDYAKYKDLKSRYDPDDDGIEQGYRQGDKRNRRVLQLAKRNNDIMKKARKIAIQRARKLPGDEGVRRKGRPRKSTTLGDGYNSAGSNSQKSLEDLRMIPNVALHQTPWFEQGRYVGGFFSEFFHTCIRPNDPPYKERSYGRNLKYEGSLLKSVSEDYFQIGPTAHGSVAGGNIMQQNASEGSGIGSQSQNSEATTFGDIGNNHFEIMNPSGQPFNETISQMSNEPNENPFYKDPFNGRLRNLVYQYTLDNVPEFAEREQPSQRNVSNSHLSNEQVPKVVRNDKKRRNISIVSEESVTVKKSRRGPPRRSINVQSLPDTDDLHKNDSSSIRDEENEQTILQGSNLESSSNEPGADMTLSGAKTSKQDVAIPELAPNQAQVITELAPDTEAETLPETPEREAVFAGPFQIMTTKKVPAASVSPMVAMPENENLPMVKDSTTNLSIPKPAEIRSILKPLRTYGNPKNGKRRLVVSRPSWQNSDDKQFEAYKSAIPVVKADVSQISTNLYLPGTSGQTSNSTNNGSGSSTPSASPSLGPDVSLKSDKDSSLPTSTTQESSKPPVLTATGNAVYEPNCVKDDMVIQNYSYSGNSSGINDTKSRESNTNIVTLTGHENNGKTLDEKLSQSNNEGVGKIPSSDVETEVYDYGTKVHDHDVQKVSYKNAQVSTSTSTDNKSSNDNLETSAKCVAEPSSGDVTKNELVELDAEKEGEASTKPPSSNIQNQNEVPNKDPTEATLNLEESKNFTTPKESNSTSTNPTARKQEIQFNTLQLLQFKSFLSRKDFSTASSSTSLSVQDLNPLSKPTSTKLINSAEVNLESTENREDKTTVTVTTPEIPPSSHSLVSNGHDVSDFNILPSSNVPAPKVVTTPLILTSTVSSIQASDGQQEKPGFSSSVSLIKDNASFKQSNLQPTGAENSVQVCLSTNDQIVPGKTVPEIPVVTPLLEKSSPSVVPNDLCMVYAKDVVCQLLDMVEQKENECPSTIEKSHPENESAPSNADLSLEKEKGALETETVNANDCRKKSQVVPSTSEKKTTAKLNEPTACINTSSTGNLLQENLRSKSQEKITKSQVTPKESRLEDPEIICLDSDGEGDSNGAGNNFSQDITGESDDDVECNSEIAQLNSRLLPHDALPGEESKNSDGVKRISSEIPRPLTPVEQLEKIINEKLRRKAKRPYDEEEDRIKVGKSVVNHAKRTEIRLRSLVACYVVVEKLPVEKLSERDRNQLKACNPVKRSTRLLKKRKRVVECAKNVLLLQDPNTDEEMESDEYNESDSDIEILEIKEVKEPNKTPALSSKPKPPRGMPQCRKRKFTKSTKQLTAHGSKILKICSTPSNSNDSGVSGGNGSDPGFELPSGSSTEVEDEDFEPGANSTSQNYPSELYPKINCNPLSPDEVIVDDQVDPLALNDNDGLTYDQGVTEMITEPECVVGLQVAVGESMSNLQPKFSKSQNGIGAVNSLMEETKEGEDPDCQDVAKENFTQESSDSDCEIIEDEDSSECMGKPTQIPLRQETRRIISSSLPPSATNTNLEKRLTRSSEHIKSRSARLTTDKSLLYQCSSLSLDENSSPDVIANTEDTDHLILSPESTKEAESAELITSDDVLQNKEDEETRSGEGMYILPDENTEDSCNNEESSDSNRSMEVDILQSADCPTTPETILSDIGQHDQFVNKMTDQQINLVTNDIENDTSINIPQIATIPVPETCEARDASSQEEAMAVANQSDQVEKANEENHCDISKGDDDVVFLDMDMTANNDTPINSSSNETVLEQDVREQISLHYEPENVQDLVVDDHDQVSILPGERNLSEPEVDLSVEEVNEDILGLSASDDDIVVLDTDTSTSINSPPKEMIPEQEASEQLSLPLQRIEPVVDLCVEKENEDHFDLSASEDYDMTAKSESSKVGHVHCEPEPERDECPSSIDKSASADVTRNSFETLHQISNDKHDHCDNELQHQNLLEDPDSEIRSVVTSDNVAHPCTDNDLSEPFGNENDDDIKKLEESIDVEIQDVSDPSITDFQPADSVQFQQQQTFNSNKEDESDHTDIFEIVDEDLEEREEEEEEEKDHNFEVEEELSTSSEEYLDASSDVGTTSAAGNETIIEFSTNWSRKVTSPPHVVDTVEAEFEEVGSSPPVFIPEGESLNQEKETCQKSPQAEESFVDLEEDGMSTSTQEDSSTIPEVMSIAVDETVSSVAYAEHVDSPSPLTPSLNEDDDDQDQEWVLSSMHMDIEEPGSPEMPELTNEAVEYCENDWDSDDEPPQIDKYDV